MVLIWLARTLRRWKPLYEHDLGTMVDSAIQMLEPPRICWDEGRSQLETLAFQSLDQSSTVAIQQSSEQGSVVVILHEGTSVMNCNNLCVTLGSSYVTLGL